MTLYTPAMLALAVELADYPLTNDLPLRREVRSQTCGSTLDLGLDVEAASIRAVGARVTACAVGQAAAALFLRSAVGKEAGAVSASLADVEAWLGGGPLPAWPGFETIAAARDYPGRHGTILLPWRAATSVLCKEGAAG